MYIAKGLRTRCNTSHSNYSNITAAKDNCLNLLEQKARSSEFGGLQGA
jgi:hypothetical protein